MNDNNKKDKKRNILSGRSDWQDKPYMYIGSSFLGLLFNSSHLL